MATAVGGLQRSPIRVDGLARTGGLLLIWLLLLIFIVYPLLMLLARAFSDNGAFTAGALVTAVKSPSNLKALRNSLLLPSTG
jgi:iron(III) transport system permease protein